MDEKHGILIFISVIFFATMVVLWARVKILTMTIDILNDKIKNLESREDDADRWKRGYSDEDFN